jgi:hypothetical protein
VRAVLIVQTGDYNPMEEELIILYRPTGETELSLVEAADYRRWPARLPEQPFFYAVTNQEYAEQIAEKWNARDSGVGYVTRFRVRKAFMDNYPVHQVGGAIHTEWWIPAEDLECMNDNIVGLIEVTGEFRA